MTNIFDLDGTAQLGGRNSREENYETFSQELQIGRSSRSIDWIVGLYYFHENNYARANGLFPPFLAPIADVYFQGGTLRTDARSEENTSELQSLMRISYAVFF